MFHKINFRHIGLFCGICGCLLIGVAQQRNLLDGLIFVFVDVQSVSESCACGSADSFTTLCDRSPAHLGASPGNSPSQVENNGPLEVCFDIRKVQSSILWLSLLRRKYLYSTHHSNSSSVWSASQSHSRFSCQFCFTS